MPAPRSSANNTSASAFGRTTRSALIMPSCRRPATTLHGYLAASTGKRRDMHRLPTAPTGSALPSAHAHGSGLSAQHRREDGATAGGVPPPQDGMDQWDRLLSQEYGTAHHQQRRPPHDTSIAQPDDSAQHGAGILGSKARAMPNNGRHVGGHLPPTTTAHHVDPVGDVPLSDVSATQQSGGQSLPSFSIPPPLVLLPSSGRPPRPAPTSAPTNTPAPCLHSAPSSSLWEGWHTHHDATRFLCALQGDSDTWHAFRAQVVHSIQRHVAQRLRTAGGSANTSHSHQGHDDVPQQRATAGAQCQSTCDGMADGLTVLHQSRHGFVSAAGTHSSSRRSKAGSTSTSVDSGRRAPHGRKNRSTCSTSSTVLSSLRSSEMNLMWERESARSGLNVMP